MRARGHLTLVTATVLASVLTALAPLAAASSTRQPAREALGAAGSHAVAFDSSARPGPSAVRAMTRGAGNGPAGSAQADVSSAHYGAAELAAVGAILGSLDHGAELSTLSVYVAAPDEIGRVCGATVVACYLPSARKMLVSGLDRPVAGVPRAFAIAHEYGHHIANSRATAEGTPDAGTARWATYERVCQLSRRGSVVPDAGPGRYWDDPEEAFADAYARLNRPETGLDWQYASLLRPTAAALAKIHADVTRPYAGPSTVAWSGSLSSPPAGHGSAAAGHAPAEAGASSAAAGRPAAAGIGAARAVSGRPWLASRTIRTPLDGRVAISLRATPGAPLNATLRDAESNRVLARATTAPDGTAQLSYSNCGRETLRLDLRATATATATTAVTPFEATITRP